MNRVPCKSIETIYDDEFSDVESAYIERGAIEIYPAVHKTISLSLEELKGIVAEIEALAE